jgi:hypothetical protein
VAGTYPPLTAPVNPRPSWNFSKTYIYDQAMERIERQCEAHKLLAKQVLMWLTCAFRPLSVKELQHALAVELNTTSLDLSAVYDEEILISVCEGLVVIDEEQNVVCFARK